MDKKFEKALRKMSKDQLAAEMAEFRELLSTEPDNAEAKEAIALIDELLAAIPPETPEEKPAAKEQTFEEQHAALITGKVNAGLTRHGAIQSIKDQIANDEGKAKAAKK